MTRSVRVHLPQTGSRSDQWEQVVALAEHGYSVTLRGPWAPFEAVNSKGVYLREETAQAARICGQAVRGEKGIVA